MPLTPSHLSPPSFFLPVGADLSAQMLVVGQGPAASFATITEAMDFIPWGIDEATVNPNHNWTARYTILVLPGYYEEQIVCKPFVTIHGLAKESVFLQAPTFPTTGAGTPIPLAVDPWVPDPRYNGYRAHIYLASNCTINNVTIGIRNFSGARSINGSPMDYVLYGYGVVGISLTNISITPFSSPPASPAATNPPLALGKALRIEGAWHTLLATDMGVTYFGNGPPDPSEPFYAVELVGSATGSGNADTHLDRCFFDAIFVGFSFDQNGNPTYAGNRLPVPPAVGGCLLVQDLYEVHVRNSLFRTTVAGAAVSIQASVANMMNQQLVESRIEGSTLTCSGVPQEPGEPFGAPMQTLDVGAGASCRFMHSWTDATFVEKGGTLYGYPNGDPMPWSRLVMHGT